MNRVWSVLGSKAGPPTDKAKALGRHMYEKMVGILKDITNVRGIEVILSTELDEGDAIQITEGNVGIKLVAVPLLFHYAYSELRRGDTSDSIDNITKCLVLCCPDNTTLWNIRKQLLGHEYVEESWENELELTKLVLALHPKSSETFAHRRWMFKKKFATIFTKIPRMLALNDVPNFKCDRQSESPNGVDAGQACVQSKTLVYDQKVKEHSSGGLANHKLHQFEPNKDAEMQPLTFQTLGDSIDQLLNMAHEELSVCIKAASKQKSNYNGWAHKTWVINIIKNMGKTVADSRPTVFQNEDAFTSVYDAFSHAILEFFEKDFENMLILSGGNVSDISVLNSILHSAMAWSELSVCLKFTSKDLSEVWKRVLHHNSSLLELYGDHESLWCQRRNIFLYFRRLNIDFCGNIVESDDFSIKSEINFCEKFTAERIGSPSSSYTKRHIEYLDKFLK